MIPTHNTIRDFNSVMSMAECHDLLINSPISVMVTEDGCEWIRDGHHRAAALWLVYGYVPQKYIKYEKFTYLQIDDINIGVGWITPFNPITTCRLPNFGYYRDTIKFVSKSHGEDHTKNFIRLYPFLYSEPRKITTIEALLIK